MSTPRVAVENRSVLGLDRRLLPATVGILAVVVLFAAVLPAIEATLQHEEEIPPGTVLDVGQGVSYTPANGWGIDLDAIGVGSSGADVVNGGVSFTVRTGPFAGGLDAFVETVNEEVEARFDYRIHGAQATVRTTQGVTGVGEAFGGPNLQGQLFAFVNDGVGVQVIASGPEGTVAAHSGAIDAMTVSILFASQEQL